MVRFFKKPRKHPIQRDEYGQSLRQRSCDLFRAGLRPAAAAKQLKANFNTVCRYFQDWKHEPENYEITYKAWHKGLRNNTEFSDALIKTLAVFLEITEEEVITRMQTPWFLTKLLKGEIVKLRKKEIHSQQEARLANALSYIHLLELSSGSSEWITAEFKQLIIKAGRLGRMKDQI